MSPSTRSRVYLAASLLFLPLLLVIILLPLPSSSHGGLTFTPSRNVAGEQWQENGVDWNAGNGETNGGFVGGFDDERVTSVCGSPAWDQSGPIVATYQRGQVVSFEVTITAPHMGYYEFRLCTSPPPSSSPSSSSPSSSSPSSAFKSEMARCFMRGRLLVREFGLLPGEKCRYVGNGPEWTEENRRTRWRAPSLNLSNPGDMFAQDGHFTGRYFRGYPIFSLNYTIPTDVFCDHCVLNWFYQTTNSAISDVANSVSIVQGERFWNCADVRII